MIRPFTQLTAFLVVLFLSLSAGAQNCPTGQTRITVVLTPDNYPGEISWILQNQMGDTLMRRDSVVGGQVNRDSVCVPAGTCVYFTIVDSYGDGICCAHGNGSYQLLVNGLVQASGGQFGRYETKTVNCGSSQSCQQALVVDTGSYVAPVRNSWFSFKPDSLGAYSISTCGAPTGWDTRIWVYNNCSIPQLVMDNTGTILYNDTNSVCGQRARVQAYMDTATTYLIRIGGANAPGPIPFNISFIGAIAGCPDSNACNYSPLATVFGPCYYNNDPMCPPGPDLTIAQGVFETSLQRSTVSSTTCRVQEKCLTGFGTRTIIRFTTDIRNIGQSDYFIGSPSTHPGQFNTVNCHNHTHYEGYAEYVLYPEPTAQGSRIPIGFKNGFCVMDLDCPPGMAKYGCSNMGITAGCGDIYSRSLECQWIDITDVPDGDYILAMKVNWDQSPDALGRYETNYANNWAQVCLNIYTNAQGKQFTRDTSCAPYRDCAGVAYGNALRDCEGVCGGRAMIGDLNADTVRNAVDYGLYSGGLLQDTLRYSVCKDATGDSLIDVWDLVQLGNCLQLNGSSGSCNFPQGLKNPAQTVQVRIDVLDTVQNYIDISMRNNDAGLVAMQFQVHGLRFTSAMSLLLGGMPAHQFQVGADGMVLFTINNFAQEIPRSGSWRSAVRLFFSRTTDSLVYLEGPRVAVNNGLEKNTLETDLTRFRVFRNTTSVKDLSRRPSFIAFPNPSEGQFRLQGLPDARPVSLQVFDNLGRLIQEIDAVDFSSGATDLDLGGLPPAVYHLMMRGSSGTAAQRVWIRK
ncbi:MAG: hypothetical protein FJY18_02620 [Bacteroidetes bacterium]|nr:hypothetical protein [Bacteroidota bacterium]